MSKFKMVFGALLVIPLLVVAGGAAFILTLDPNRLKPLVTEVAAKQGLSVQINGDIAWRLYPNIGLDVADVHVTNQATSAELASLKSARLDVALKPLLERKIEVVGIGVDGAELNYLLDEQGRSNWPTIEADTTAKQEPASGEGNAPEINIASLFVSDLALNYQDAEGVSVKVEGLNTEAVGVNLSGKAFDLTVQSAMSYTGYPTVWLEGQGMVAIDVGLQQAKLEDFTTALYIDGRKPHQAADLTSQVSATVNWVSPLTIKSTFSVETGDLRRVLTQVGIALPATQDPAVFRLFSLQASAGLTGDAFVLEQAVLKLDKTVARAKLAVTGFERPKIKASIDIDSVNVDDYLAPALNKSTPKAENTGPVAAVPLPFEMLRRLDARLKLRVGNLLVNGIDINNVDATVLAGQGLITLKPYSLELAEGVVNAEVVLDASAAKEQAKLKGWVTTTGINLAPLLEQLKQDPLLAGELGSRVSFTSQGYTDQDLTNNLKATIDVNSALIKLTTMNIEKSFCDAVAMLSGKPASQNEWPAYSELAPLSLKASYSGQKIKLESLSADIQRLRASSYGELDLESGDFKFPLDVNLADFAGGLEGCVLVDEKWRKRTVPLRCKGNLINIGAKTCLPDGPRITKKLKDKAKQEVTEHLDEARDDIEEKAKKEADRFLEKHVDEDDIDALKESVKGLFKFK